MKPSLPMSLPDKISRLHDYLELGRVSNLPTVWMNTLAAALLSGGSFSLSKTALLMAAFSMIYSGGMAMNDCVDSAADAVRRPLRPIPSSRIPFAHATLAYLILFAGAMLMIHAVGGKATLEAGLILLILVTTYNLTHNHSVLAIIPMAACRFMIYIITSLAISNSLADPLLVVAALQAGYILLLSVVARLEKGNRIYGRFLPSVPIMLAGIPLIDGLFLAWFLQAGWLAVGIATGAATLALQKKFRGD